MIESTFIKDIIEATIAGEKHETQMAGQVNHLEATSGIDPFRLTNEQLTETFGDKDHELAKVELIKEDQKIQADVSVHFVNGIIDRIEIWNKKGDYPEDDLASWELISK